MKFKGRVWKFGADIDTDKIIPARYLNTSDPVELAKHCMEDEDASFASKVRPGDIIVADKTFGCGSSREHAPIAIKAAGVACIIAKSYARIFYRNSFNMGLPILESDEVFAATDSGEELEVATDGGGRTTRFVDLKENDGGRFLQIAELSNDRRSTVVIPLSGLAAFMEVLQKISGTAF